MTKRTDVPRVPTGISNLDELLQGGLPKGSVAVVSGPPGSGKTILTQQICFHNASPKNRALCLGTLSEPTAKTLRHLQPFSFFVSPGSRPVEGVVEAPGRLTDR